jgi:adenylate cyclase
MLKSLDDEASQMMVENLLQATNFPQTLRQLIGQKAEGNPFFVEELIRDLIEQQVLVQRGEQWEMVGEPGILSVPDTVEGLIQARLDRLDPDDRAILQAASVIGRRFAYKVLELIVAENAQLSQHLLHLQRADLVREWARFPEQEYMFKHVLVQETAYRTLLNEKKKNFHRQLGQRLEKLFPDRLDELSARLAFHFEAAGMADEAVDYLLQAGKRAARLGSSQEAAIHLQRGLELLRTLPKSPDNERKELALLTAYGASLVPVLGYNSEQINATFRRAHLLSQKLDTATSGPVLRYLALSSLARAEFIQTFNYGQQLLDLAGRNQDIVSRVEGYYVQGVASYWQGHFARARQILSRAIDSYEPEQNNEHLALYSQDPRVVCLSRLAVVLWFLGYPDQAAQTNQEAVALARKLTHPSSLGIVLTWTSWLHHLSWDSKAMLKQTDEAIAFCLQENLAYWLPINMIFNGWTLITQILPQ